MAGTMVETPTEDDGKIPVSYRITPDVKAMIEDMHAKLGYTRNVVVMMCVRHFYKEGFGRAIEKANGGHKRGDGD